MSSYQRSFTHGYYLFFVINIIIEYLHRSYKVINGCHDDTIRSDSDNEEPSYSRYFTIRMAEIHFSEELSYDKFLQQSINTKRFYLSFAVFIKTPNITYTQLIRKNM